MVAIDETLEDARLALEWARVLDSFGSWHRMNDAMRRVNRYGVSALNERMAQARQRPFKDAP